MGLLTKEVDIAPGNNQKWYETKGYKIPKSKNVNGRLRMPRGTTISIKVEDLPDGSHAPVDIKCDGCEKILKDIKWQDYILHKHDDKYYCIKCKKSYKFISFEQWCIDNNRQDVLDRWDYSLNNCKPNEISYGTVKKYWFKCTRGIHKSELKIINSITSELNIKIVCNQCNSFAQWGIDNICEDFLEKYWDYDKNTINPWEIAKCTNKPKVWIKCQEKDYHESYDVSCHNFTTNKSRCPYCAMLKIHKYDSLGYIFPQVLSIWSKKNKINPYKYTTYNDQKVWWKCPDGKHKDYYKRISDARQCDFRCPDCSMERKESFLQEKLRLYLQKLNYKTLHETNCTIIPKNPKTKSSLPFDNEIVELKLVIEVMGLQHYEICGFHQLQAKHKRTTLEQELHYQKLKDRYKRIYAKSKGYFYLEIPYWTDNEETWKKLIDDKIEYIKLNPIPLQDAM